MPITAKEVGPIEICYSLLEWNLTCCHDTCASCRKNIQEVRELLRTSVGAANGPYCYRCGEKLTKQPPRDGIQWLGCHYCKINVEASEVCSGSTVVRQEDAG